MRSIIADTHTHTVACDHAYSTITENAAAAKKRGLRFLCMTEHAPALPGSPTQLYFGNLRVIPPVLEEVVILKGAEVNILDREGNLDLSERVLDRLDWVIASFHTPVFPPGSRGEHTSAWMAIAENPLVDVVGHCGDGRYPFDEKAVIRAFARHGKIVEINAHSFSARPGSRENCPRIARLCAEEGVRIAVSSDAHFYDAVGSFDAALGALEEIRFPEELIVNGDYSRFLAIAKEKAVLSTLEYLNTL